MADVGRALRAAGVAAVYLLHGTFVGADALGLLRKVGRLSPRAAAPLRRLHKQALDKIAKDAGNFTREYAAAFQEAINADAADSPHRIEVRLFEWSSENHHVGRADGAVRLMDELLAADIPAGSRLLLWGHSHGGNVLALLTNLLAGDHEACEQFFTAAEAYYRWPRTHRVDMPIWQQLRQRLQEDRPPLADVALDLVTLGTPVRYGWDPGGYARLLHFIHHRPGQGLPPYQAPFPPSLDDLRQAQHGDYVQQLAIAGTDLSPTLWGWRARLADTRLRKLLQADLRRRDLLARLKLGVRVHEDGENLLVDYGVAGTPISQHVFGHAVYTRLEWMLFHAEEVAMRFYGLAPRPGQAVGETAMSDAIQVVTTTSDRADAERIAAALVGKQLAACVQVSGPVESTYRWKGGVESAEEWVCTIKTVRRLFEEVQQSIRQLHSYEEPEIVALPITNGSEGYLAWISNSVKPAGE